MAPGTYRVDPGAWSGKQVTRRVTRHSNNPDLPGPTGLTSPRSPGKFGPVPLSRGRPAIDEEGGLTGGQVTSMSGSRPAWGKLQPLGLPWWGPRLCKANITAPFPPGRERKTTPTHCQGFDRGRVALTQIEGGDGSWTERFGTCASKARLRDTEPARAGSAASRHRIVGLRDARRKAGALLGQATYPRTFENALEQAWRAQTARRVRVPPPAKGEATEVHRLPAFGGCD